LSLSASYVQFFWIQHNCVNYLFPTSLARLKDLNRYVYPRGKTAEYDHLLDVVSLDSRSEQYVDFSLVGLRYKM
jgi:hypothetical protein